MPEEQKTDANTSTDTALVVGTNTALARKQEALARQELMNEIAGDLVTDAGRGTENAGEVRPPRLLICQSGSPYRKPGNADGVITVGATDSTDTAAPATSAADAVVPAVTPTTEAAGKAKSENGIVDAAKSSKLVELRLLPRPRARQSSLPGS